MPRLLVTCPRTGLEVSTGHRTPSFDMMKIAGPCAFRCQRCGEVHTWTRDEAWEEAGLTPSAARAAASAG